MNTSTAFDYQAFVTQTHYSFIRNPQGMRIGQYFMTTLRNQFPSIYAQFEKDVLISADCYYNDQYLPGFLEWLYDHAE